jgi:hypothetical protein
MQPGFTMISELISEVAADVFVKHKGGTFDPTKIRNQTIVVPDTGANYLLMFPDIIAWPLTG